jgi:hypothetical protein
MNATLWKRLKLASVTSVVLMIVQPVEPKRQLATARSVRSMKSPPVFQPAGTSPLDWGGHYAQTAQLGKTGWKLSGRHTFARLLGAKNPADCY